MIPLSGEKLPVITQATFRYGKLQNEELALCIRLENEAGEKMYEWAMPINRLIVFVLGLVSYLYESAYWRFDGFRPPPQNSKWVESVDDASD